MSNCQGQQSFTVKLTVLAAGPVRPRRKYKDHKRLRANRTITLPFVPYAGLYLKMEKSGKRNTTVSLYLRVRTVEWLMESEDFECVADEMLGSNLFEETYEVRGSPRIEEHFTELHRKLELFGFTVDTDVNDHLALNKHPDGSWITPPEPRLIVETTPSRRPGFTRRS